MYLDFEKLYSKRQQGFFWFQPLPRGTARALVRVAFLPRCFPFFFWDWGRFLHLIGCRRWVVTHCEVGAQCATYTGDLCDGWLHLDQNSGLRRIQVFLKNQLLFYKMALEPMTKYKGRDDLQILWLSMNDWVWIPTMTFKMSASSDSFTTHEWLRNKNTKTLKQEWYLIE